jgi:hypothetical protein
MATAQQTDVLVYELCGLAEEAISVLEGGPN